MFQFTWFPLPRLCVQHGVTGHDPRRVSPFGYLRLNASVQLPVAFRCFHVLHRQLVPRHSPRTLKSLKLLVKQLLLSLLDGHRPHTMRLSKNPSGAGHLTFLISGEKK
jgi:hypothetical protein